MDKQVNKKLRKLWIHVLVIIFAIPCFFMGRAFAYWTGLVNPPADQNRTAQNPVGSGKELAVTFNFDNVHTSSAKLVPTGCSPYAYPGTTVSKTAIKDFKMSWSTTDTTALESKVLIQFMTIDLCDTFNNEIIYTNYLSNCKVLVSLGEYTTPGDPNSFNLEENKGNYAGDSLGTTPMEFMLNREEEKILRLQVSIDDYSRSNEAQYRTFKNAVVNSNFRVNFQCTVENPNLHKTTNIWAKFDTADVTDLDKGPYYSETSTYVYHPKIKIYVENQGYNAGDILYVNDSDSPHYGKYYTVLQNANININNPNTSAGSPMTWSESTSEYRSYHQYFQGDFVVEPDGIYFWDSYWSHKPNTSNARPPSNSWSSWTKYPQTILNVWQRHKAYTYGDVVRWWTNNNVGTNRTLNRYYVSIVDFNIISSSNPLGNGMGVFPGSSGYSTRWITVAQFQTRSAAFDLNRDYVEGESMLYTDGKYYIAIIDTVAGRTPVNSPNHWKEVSW